MNKFKIIALDIDGTLNNDEKVISPKTREALIKAQKNGAIVVLATGRPAPGLAREAAALDLDKYHGLLLSYNGGKVIDATTNEVLLEQAMELETAKQLLTHLEDFDVTPIVDDGVHIYTNDPTGFQMQYESTNNNLKIAEVENIAEAITFNPVKILIATPNEKLLPIIEHISAPFEEELSFIQSAPFYLEATVKGIDKAASLHTICQKLGIEPHEVIAFGDGQNDRSMLEYAGLGVAMENACAELLEMADEITLSNNHDGIAHTLEKYFILD